MENKHNLETYIQAIKDELYKRMEIDGENCIQDMVDIEYAIETDYENIATCYQFKTPVKCVCDELEQGGDFIMMAM